MKIKKRCLILVIALILLLSGFVNISFSEKKESDSSSDSADIYLSSEEFKQMVFSLAFTDQDEILGSLCKAHILEKIILLEKMISNINPGNKTNDAFYFIAKKLLMTDPGTFEGHEFRLLSKKVFTKNTKADKMVILSLMNSDILPNEIILPLTRKDLLKKDEFINIVDIVIGFYDFMGLSELVRQNPNSSRAFLLQMQREQENIYPGSNLHNFLCKMGLLYRNHHHTYELLNKINQKYGGVSEFLKEETGLGTFVSTDDALRLPMNYIGESLARIQKLLVNLKYSEAVIQLEKEIKIIDIISDNYTIWNYNNDSPYPAILFFYALIEMRLGNVHKANSILIKNLERYPHSAFFIDMNIEKHKELVDQTFIKFKLKKQTPFSFDSFVLELTGSRYVDLILNYDIFNLKLIKNNDLTKETYDRYKALSSDFTNRSNDIVTYNYVSYLMKRNLIQKLSNQKSLPNFFSTLEKAEFYKYKNNWLETARFYKMHLSELLQSPENLEGLHKLDVEIAKTNYYVGSALVKDAKADVALPYLLTALEFFESRNNPESKRITGSIYNNIGAAYKISGSWDLSEKWLLKSEKFNMQHDNTITVLGYTYGHMCEVHLWKDNVQKAVFYGKKSISICSEHNLVERECITISALQILYESLKDHISYDELEKRKETVWCK